MDAMLENPRAALGATITDWLMRLPSESAPSWHSGSRSSRP